MRILLSGDTHGNAKWLGEYIFPTAMALDCDKIIVLGDFGYWEHTADGVAFLNEVDCLIFESGIPLYWLAGNHDNWSYAVQQYDHDQDPEGFMPCRKNLFYIPQGHAWSWAGHSLRAFGGAYSVDKAWRLKLEARDGAPGTLWFPDEEMTDADMDRLLAADDETKCVILSHDKPESAEPGWHRKTLPLCVPNQRRLQRALAAHQPRYWVHGHLHYRYTDVVPAGTRTTTSVIGLDPDRAAAETGWRHKQTWALMELGEQCVIIPGDQGVEVDVRKYQDAKSKLY